MRLETRLRRTQMRSVCSLKRSGRVKVNGGDYQTHFRVNISDLYGQVRIGALTATSVLSVPSLRGLDVIGNERMDNQRLH